MATLNQEITISGKCLMDGKESFITVFPSEKKGIRFYTNSSGVAIEAKAENVISTLNCTVLGFENQQIRLVEHFMAACAFAGIDSLDVCVDRSELPILDGSALQWFKEFQTAGIKKKKDQQIVFDTPLYLAEGNTQISLIPSDNFKVTYMVNFDHAELSNSWISWDFSKDNQEIIEARTFGYLKDLEKFQKAGMALGVSINNTIGLTDDGYTVDLRSDFEPVKHKILDLVGDLMLTGFNPLDFKAHIIAKEAGHKAHVEFAKVINKSENKVKENQ